jgi:hypothetical protein
MDSNSIFYGNPNIEQLNFINSKGLVDVLFESLKDEVMPKNDSELTKEELNEISDYLKIIAEEENKEFLNRYKAYDKNLVHVITTIFKEKNIDVEGLCLDIVKDINPLISKLKYHFQRPRPHQLAYYYKLKLFPYKSDVAQSPSYPSGHTTQAYVILNVIGNKYPELYNYCKDIIDDISLSRIYLGLHYQSDNDFAKFVGKQIIKNKEFSKKYEI